SKKAFYVQDLLIKYAHIEEKDYCQLNKKLKILSTELGDWHDYIVLTDSLGQFIETLPEENYLLWSKHFHLKTELDHHLKTVTSSLQKHIHKLCFKKKYKPFFKAA
ncbi:hypothetical protein, partial [Xanthovirga aplysinae]|uniref:hypothetical protein n=1 Tax=Xanthovirga aplysinae TaxID=2529853 RepID=UPI001656E7D9